MKLEKTKIELNAAQHAIERLKKAETYPEIKAAWQDVVSRLEKTWTKAKLECTGCVGEARRLLDTAAASRSSDELLIYLSQARHADQHSLESGTSWSLGMRIEVPPGASVTLDFEKGTAQAQDGDVQVAVAGPVYALIPVKNRGVTFNPPEQHLGNPVKGTDPITVAETGFSFYSQLVSDLEQC